MKGGLPITEKTITVPAKIDPAVFCRFAVFDTLYRRKRWQPPALFAAIMSAFAAACFAFSGSREGAVMLGTVLLAVGLGLPAVYLLSFLLSVRKQGRLLDGGKPTYTLSFSREGVRADASGERADYRWEKLFFVYRRPGCIYLYVDSAKAFLLPEDGQGDALWELIKGRLPPEKLRDMR